MTDQLDISRYSENAAYHAAAKEPRQSGSERRLVRGLPQRVVKSRNPSPFAKSKITSSFREDVTVDQHGDDLRKFIAANDQVEARRGVPPNPSDG